MAGGREVRSTLGLKAMGSGCKERIGFQFAKGRDTESSLPGGGFCWMGLTRRALLNV